MKQLLETLAVFGCVNHVRAGADDGHAFGFQAQGQLQRGLTAVLHDHAHGLFFGDDFQHVFQCQRFKVQAVAGVVVGGHSFRIAIDHDGFIAVFAHGQRRMHTAVIKLNALADAVGSAAQHHDFLTVSRCSFAFLLVGRIHVGGVGRKLGGTGVYPLEHRAHA